MSYSFSFRAAAKDEAKQLVADKMDDVVSAQPIHEVDAKMAHDTTCSAIDLVRDDEAQDISVSVNGSVWGVEEGLNSVSVSVNVSLIAKEKPAS